MTLSLGHALWADFHLAPCIKCGGQRMRCAVHDDVPECMGECRYPAGTEWATPIVKPQDPKVNRTS